MYESDGFGQFPAPFAFTDIRRLQAKPTTSLRDRMVAGAAQMPSTLLGLLFEDSRDTNQITACIFSHGAGGLPP